MYTAKIQRKDYINGAIRVFVEFTNGTEIYTESCIPQDENGFKHWVKSRLDTLNSASIIETNYLVGSTIDISDPVPISIELTVEEIARNEWIENYRKWLKVKETLIDTGVLTGSEIKVLQLQNKVKTDFLSSYIDYI